MSFQKEIQAIKQKKFQPLYTIQGSEQYLQEQFLDTLINTLMEDDPELDVLRLDFSQASIVEVIDEAETYSFFSQLRLIVVSHCDLLSTKPANKLTKGEEQRLAAYLDQPNPATILVFSIDEDKIDNRKKVTKLFKKQTVFIDVTPLDERKVQQYVEAYIKNSGMSFTREAVAELLSRTNYHLSQVMNEMGKLETYALSGKSITIDVVRELVPRTLESDVFELTNAVVNRQVNRAIQIYQDLILMKNEPIALHALLVSQFRLILQCTILARLGYREAEIAQHLNVHPYRVKLALQSAKRTPIHFQAQFYQELAQVDLNMKTGVGNKENDFYLLLTKLVNM